MVRPVYSGDVNIEHGGTWYKIDPTGWDEYGYCSAIRVTPCSDAGAQSNAWWIEELTVIKPRSEEELKNVLSCCGWIHEDDRGIVLSHGAKETVVKPGTKEYRRLIAECCVGYGIYDVDRSETVQIGQHAEDSNEHAEKTILRANASLERYVKRNFVRGM